MTNKKHSFQVGQDWASVISAFLIMLLVLVGGYSIKTPSFGPKDGIGSIDALFSSFTNASLAYSLGLTLVLCLGVAIIGQLLSGSSLKSFVYGFIAIYVIAIFAQFCSSFTFFKDLGLETVLFSLLIGLLIGNLFRLPAWLSNAVQTELYVKIGLVLLGCTILFGDVMQAGGKGLIQGAVVVIAVWYFAFWVAKKLKVDDEFSTMLASAVSICGVSAAIATAGAINGDKKKLSFIISLVLIVAIPMMIFMPVIAQWMGLADEVTGAWLGGTIDTTGAVVAAGTIAGDVGLKYATIIKFSQNVLLGIAAFCISVFWAYRSRTGKSDSGAPQQRVSLKIIWERFPKFVLGFIVASLVFSFLLDAGTAKAAGSACKSLSTFWFNLAFVCIGLETRFSDFKRMGSKKPMYAFLIAQGFNIVLTLLVAWLLFG